MNKIILKEKLTKFSDYWSPKIIAELNESYVKLAKLKGEFVWHKHDHEDEMFFVLDGMLTIQFHDKEVMLEPGDMIVIPKGIEHRPVADQEVAVMLIESKTTLNTGDVVDSEKTVHELEWI